MLGFRIERPLPGELDGTLNPRDYGFGVVEEEPLSDAERHARIGAFYMRVTELTGVVIPELERYRPVDPEIA